MRWRHLLPLYVAYSTICPYEFVPYPMDVMMIFGLLCCGLLCFSSRLIGITLGVVLLFCHFAYLLEWPLGLVGHCLLVTCLVIFAFVF